MSVPPEPAAEARDPTTTGELGPTTLGAPRPTTAAAMAPRASRVRSFACRGSRMPQGHQSAYDAMAPGFVIPVPRDREGDDTTVDTAYRLDLAAAFGRIAPLVIEIGPGSGDALRAGAAARPEWDFLAIEVWRPGIGQTLSRMRLDPLPNVRFVEADAALAMATMVPPGCAREVWTFFPDPWPKRRHQSRRLVNPAFATTVASTLGPQGVWRLATDWAAYGQAMRRLLDVDDRFELESTEQAPLRPLTRFERKGLDVGRSITNLNYVHR